MKNKLHIKVGDKVKVISGDQKGYIGIIKTILSKRRAYFKKESKNSKIS
jgi:ribosomal protein L24